MIQQIKKYFFPFSVLLVCIFYFFDLSNLDALRQGTEGFYLQISKEMFEANSFLTPYYRGVRHWSKPFLHFLFPFPLYETGLFSNIQSARLSIALLTIFTIYISSKLLESKTKIAPYATFLFFLSSIGLIKYGRIFMMEIPLSLLCFVGSLYFYDYLQRPTKKNLFLATFFIGSSILIKGPVSFVLSTVSIGAYILFNFFYKKEAIPFKKLIIYASFVIFFSSLWFIKSYITYGDEFFNYFFLRENMGKFSTKSYPIRHVFQGLLIFSLPWSIFLPSIVKSNYKKLHFKNDFINFISFHAFFFFVIWLIPTQRSHHYAMPAIPFFLTLILFGIKDNKVLISRFANWSITLFMSLILLLLLVPTFKPGLFPEHINLTVFMLFTLMILLLSIITFIKSQNISLKALSCLVFTGWIWVFVAPQFIPAQLPQKAISIIGDRELVGYVNKPYFIEEAIGRPMVLIEPATLPSHINSTSIFIIDSSYYQSLRFSQKCTILTQWKIWKRRTRMREIISAISSNNINGIKTEYVLFECKL